MLRISMDALARARTMLTMLSVAALTGVLAVAAHESPVTYALVAGVADIDVHPGTAVARVRRVLGRRHRRCRRNERLAHDVDEGESSAHISAEEKSSEAEPDMSSIARVDLPTPHGASVKLETLEPAVPTPQPAVSTPESTVPTQEIAVPPQYPAVSTTEPAVSTSESTALTPDSTIPTPEAAVLPPEPAVSTADMSSVACVDRSALHGSNLSPETLEPAVPTLRPAASTPEPVVYPLQSEPAASTSDPVTLPDPMDWEGDVKPKVDVGSTRKRLRWRSTNFTDIDALEYRECMPTRRIQRLRERGISAQRELREDVGPAELEHEQSPRLRRGAVRSSRSGSTAISTSPAARLTLTGRSAGRRTQIGGRFRV